MNNSKIERLREIQELLKSEIISQTEFDKMKSEILNDSRVQEDMNSNLNSETKVSHRTRNIVLSILAVLIVLGGAVGGGAYYFSNRADNADKKLSVSSSSARTKENSSVTSRSSLSSSSSSILSSSSSSVSSSSSTEVNDQKFTSLSQKEQLALLIAWGADKGGASSQINQSNTLTADLSQPNQITLYPTPGNMGIGVRDNHDGTFDMEVVMDGQETASGNMTGNELVEQYYSNRIEPIVSKINFK